MCIDSKSSQGTNEPIKTIDSDECFDYNGIEEDDLC